MLIHKLPQTPYTAFPLDWQVWAQENIFILHSANVFRDERWTLLGNQILHRRSGIISIRVTHPRLYKCLQVHVIANARLVRFVLVRLSPNWPNTNETVANGRCQQEMWQHTPRLLFHRERVQKKSYLVVTWFFVGIYGSMKNVLLVPWNLVEVEKGSKLFFTLRKKKKKNLRTVDWKVLWETQNGSSMALLWTHHPWNLNF